MISPRPFNEDPFKDYDPQACFDTLSNPDAPLHLRMNALVQIVQGNSVDALMALLPLFKAEAGMALELRQALAIAFGEWASESATEALLSCYNTETEPKALRLVALEALGKTQHTKALDCLMKALQHEDDDVFGTAAAVPELILMLEEGKDDIQCIAAWHLGKLKNQLAIDPLVKVLDSHETADVLALCAWALGQIGEARQDVLEALQAKQEHPSEEVAQRAKDALIKVRRNLN